MKFYKYILTMPVILISLLFVACEDRIDYSQYVIGEGEALVEATLEFKPDVTNLGGSRSAGNAISAINNLAVVVYNADGEFISLHNNVQFTKLQSTTEKPSDYPTGDNGEDISSDNATAKVQFNMKLPFGKYYMYAVANLGRTLTEEEVSTIEKLKAIECTWNQNNVSANAQMFGYFTNDVTTGNTAFENDPTVTVNQKSVKLHSWIKRLASKVTIAFDGSRLHQGIVVYIHNVSIRQIPLKCTLGEGNKAESEDDVTSAAFDESVANSVQALYFNNKDNNKGTATTTATPYDISKHNGWLEVANGSGPNSDGKIGIVDNHYPDAQALFFYENMQGVHPDKPKEQQRAQVGTNVAPPGIAGEGQGEGDYKDFTSEDYKDGVEWGTFIEVEAYYQCDTIPTSNGAIRYRFMLGQNTSDDYNAIRNHHYKLTLGFNGYANQPDWHIQYQEEAPEIYAPEVYIPYTYNTSVQLPMRFNGNLVKLTAEIIENNWAPYDETEELEVPAKDSYGTTNFNTRTLEFVWNRTVFVNGNGPALAYNSDGSPSNAANNYLYGRHLTNYYHLDENGEDILTQPYYVSPIWAGFFRLMQPTAFVNSISTDAAVLLPNTDEIDSNNYYSMGVRKAFMDYFFGKFSGGRGSAANNIDLSYREFKDVENPGSDEYNKGNNAYKVEKGIDATGQEYTTVTMNLWTQPKSMCGISGFSGNNPYEDYNRKGVIRFTATFDTEDRGRVTIRKDVPVIQAKRLVNPKAVWRRHDNPEEFNVTVMERNLQDESRLTFQPVVSRGAWSAKILDGGDKGFFTIDGGTEVIGKTLSQIKFKIDFVGKIGYTDSKCAIIEVRYHNNTCVHNIFVRQGYHQPLQISNDANAPYWSSYNVYSCDPSTPYGEQTAEVSAVQTRSPLAFGAFFKKGNYAQGISVSNISRNGDGQPRTNGFGPLQYPTTSGQFYLTGINPPEPATWANIQGNTTEAWHWAPFSITLNYTDNGEEKTEIRKYRVPTIAEFDSLKKYDFGVGVMYGDGTEYPAGTTTDAFGFLDPDNTTTSHLTNGMRGFICYNSSNANQIFFPIGTSGIGRRTTQAAQNSNQRGILRYSSVRDNLSNNTLANTGRPICINMSNAPGTVYWAYTGQTGYGSWDFNYFDLNFNALTHNFTSGTGTNTYENRGPNGDALPLRLVLIGKPSDYQ